MHLNERWNVFTGFKFYCSLSADAQQERNLSLFPKTDDDDWCVNEISNVNLSGYQDNDNSKSTRPYCLRPVFSLHMGIETTIFARELCNLLIL